MNHSIDYSEYTIEELQKMISDIQLSIEDMKNTSKTKVHIYEVYYGYIYHGIVDVEVVYKNTYKYRDSAIESIIDIVNLHKNYLTYLNFNVRRILKDEYDCMPYMTENEEVDNCYE